VTRITVIYDTGMVINAVGKTTTTRTVANPAILGGLHVVHRRSLTTRIDTIIIRMTAGTGLHAGIYTMVKHTPKAKSGGAMTGTAIHRHHRMTQFHARCSRVIVASGTITRDVSMINERRGKRRGDMTGYTISTHRSGNMQIMLAPGNRTVVTAATRARYV